MRQQGHPVQPDQAGAAPAPSSAALWTAKLKLKVAGAAALEGLALEMPGLAQPVLVSSTPAHS